MTTTPLRMDLMDTLHGNESIHQPQHDTHHYQNFQELN